MSPVHFPMLLYQQIILQTGKFHRQLQLVSTSVARLVLRLLIRSDVHSVKNIRPEQFIPKRARNSQYPKCKEETADLNDPESGEISSKSQNPPAMISSKSRNFELKLLSYVALVILKIS